MRMDTSKMIFVFGSNLAGIHGAGAARFAKEKCGAEMGIGLGPTGDSYALPTKGTNNMGTGIGPTLPLPVIKQFVDEFLDYARDRSHLKFQVRCIGCGLAGLDHADIAPMFDQAPINCYFDTAWGALLWNKPPKQFWGTF